MKCVEMKDGRVWRVTNEEAQHLVYTSQAKYVTKAYWTASDSQEVEIADD